ncbi:MAG: DUF456 domain-containing protein [Gemmatimonadota bacterium]
MEVILLALLLLLGLIMIPFGLPGTWIIAGSALGFSILVPNSIGIFTIIAVTVLAIIGEVIEWTMTAKYTKKYGGSTRASWGAVIGGMVGAVMGVPIPIIGSVIGAFAGAFVGAFLFEMSRGTSGGDSTRVAWGALVGRALASAVKVGIGVGMAAWILFVAMV